MKVLNLYAGIGGNRKYWEFKLKHRKDQIIRNCVDPNVGKYIFDIVKKSNYDREKIGEISQ